MPLFKKQLPPCELPKVGRGALLTSQKAAAGGAAAGREDLAEGLKARYSRRFRVSALSRLCLGPCSLARGDIGDTFFMIYEGQAALMMKDSMRPRLLGSDTPPRRTKDDQGEDCMRPPSLKPELSNRCKRSGAGGGPPECRRLHRRPSYTHRLVLES